MEIAGFRINFDALLARLVYRWRYRALAMLTLLLVSGGLIMGAIPPFWHSRATLSISATPGASIQVDQRSWPFPLYAGTHHLQASMPDGRQSWADVSLRPTTPLTITLPPGLLAPRERALPPAAPGTHIDQVWWADNTWRVLSVPDSGVMPADAGQQRATPTPATPARQTVAFGPTTVEQLSTLDAYAGLADQVHVGEQLREAVYQPAPRGGFGEQALGAIEVRGWGNLHTLPISAPLTLLRFSPDGDTLLWAEQLASGGAQVYIARANIAPIPVVAVPGQIVRLAWQPDSRALVLHSVQGERLTLTLIRLSPSLVAAAIADVPGAHYAGALVPLTWDESGIFWIAPDEAGPTLWHAPLDTLIPERRGMLDARAITRLADGTLRVVVIQNQQVVIGRYLDGMVIGETTVPHVLPAPDLAGVWQNNQLVLQGSGQTWLLDIDV